MHPNDKPTSPQNLNDPALDLGRTGTRNKKCDFCKYLHFETEEQNADAVGWCVKQQRYQSANTPRECFDFEKGD
jgi:hypothetical protein